MKHPIDTWQWFGHAGHFIGSANCLFHMLTVVGDTLISTVGDYHPWRGRGDGIGKREEIGAGTPDRPALFETYTCKVGGVEQCGCPAQGDGGEVVRRYSSAAEAQSGHMAMCMEIAS